MKHLFRRNSRWFGTAVRILIFSLFCIAMPGAVSCGYHVGSMMHPQIKTVAIAEVKNETREVLASAIMRKQLAERFQFDNSLKITTPEKADCIVQCRITKVDNAGIVWKSTDEDMTFRPSEFSLTVTAEFTVLMPGVKTPLVPLRIVTGNATYQFTADPAIGRENGLIQACYKIANLVVQYTTEAW